MVQVSKRLVNVYLHLFNFWGVIRDPSNVIFLWVFITWSIVPGYKCSEGTCYLLFCIEWLGQLGPEQFLPSKAENFHIIPDRFTNRMSSCIDPTSIIPCSTSREMLTDALYTTTFATIVLFSFIIEVTLNFHVVWFELKVKKQKKVLTEVTVSKQTACAQDAVDRCHPSFQSW